MAEDKTETTADKSGAKGIAAKVEMVKAILKDKKKLMIIAPVALIVVGGGVAALMGGGGKPAPAKPEAAAHGEAAPAAEGHEAAPPAPAADSHGGGGGHGGGGHGGGDSKGSAKVAAAYRAAFLDLPDMTINLAVSDGRARYVKVAATLEFGSLETAAIIEPIMPRIQDAFQTYLRELRVTDIDGTAGVYRLKEELTRRVNVAAHPHKINGVLFREIVVQ